MDCRGNIWARKKSFTYVVRGVGTGHIGPMRASAPDLLVVCYLVNNADDKIFFRRYIKAARNGLKENTLSTQEYHILLRLLGTNHLGTADFHNLPVS